jgi:hypothetical protein
MNMATLYATSPPHCENQVGAGTKIFPERLAKEMTQTNR